MLDINLGSIKEREVVKGFRGRFIHSENMTHAYWTIEKGAALPEHAHVHEQVVNILEGKFELTVDGEKKIIEPGNIVVIPSNVPHTGNALTDCRILDVFSPVREDMK